MLISGGSTGSVLVIVNVFSHVLPAISKACITT
ncbi:MAG: hypothetical protein ACD_79C00715G0001 [uncultured bacterium]|nr:MAG: hypothetical protein ACD_79C00715G0001 [uncultured bacterium]